MKFNIPKIDIPKLDVPNFDSFRSTPSIEMPKLPEIKPAPIVPNQEKQIKLMTDMVNKQSEMINQQTELIKKQNELIALIREEAISSSKQSRLAMCLTLIGLITGFIQIIPTFSSWIKGLLLLLETISK